eukprot:TRINITY_DN9893_c0_g1_i1.p1 TRINITY_DN9893_c0_g1~~TRINITY_DN9893_c0_g1_i1.p1  ORF type:complete len:125 (+),score=14.00 TRINITY_DN9893_c0_g1_i1:73-447(+)
MLVNCNIAALQLLMCFLLQLIMWIFTSFVYFHLNLLSTTYFTIFVLCLLPVHSLSMARLFTFLFLALLFLCVSLPSVFGCDKEGGGCAKRRRNPKDVSVEQKGRRLLEVVDYVSSSVIDGRTSA